MFKRFKFFFLRSFERREYKLTLLIGIKIKDKQEFAGRERLLPLLWKRGTDCVPYLNVQVVTLTMVK